MWSQAIVLATCLCMCVNTARSAPVDEISRVTLRDSGSVELTHTSAGFVVPVATLHHECVIGGGIKLRLVGGSVTDKDRAVIVAPAVETSLAALEPSGQCQKSFMLSSSEPVDPQIDITIAAGAPVDAQCGRRYDSSNGKYTWSFTVAQFIVENTRHRELRSRVTVECTLPKPNPINSEVLTGEPVAINVINTITNNVPVVFK